MRIGTYAGALALVATALIAAPASATPSPGAGSTDFDAAACAALVGTEIGAGDIGLPTTGAVVTAANWVDETGGQCRVNGDINPVDPEAPPIIFQVNLPKDWNHRALQFGGGGLNGSVVTGLGSYARQAPGQPTPLQQGFVTLGSDSGHEGGDAAFALNDESLRNYGTLSIKKVHDVAIFLIDAAYGQAPEYFYFQGFSTGGAEALDAASLYPDDYDGVVAGTPAYNVTMQQFGRGLVYRDALYANGGAGWLNPAKQHLLVDSVYNACDPIDGLVDGVIADTEGCLSAFDIQSIRCDDGGDTGDDCLSDAQIAAVEKIASPTDLGFDIAGNSVVSPYPALNGGLLNRPAGFDYGTSGVPGPGQARHYGVGETFVRYFITQDPTTDFLTFDPQPYLDRIQEVGSIIDVTNTDWTQTLDNGVKIILYTGLADDGISPYNTIQLYNRVVASMGPQKVDQFLKFYTIPGMSHGSGPFTPSIELLPAIMDWVENGAEPASSFVGTDTTAATAGRQRPVCEYPTWPRYNGGDPASADSFTCVSGSGGIPVEATLDKPQGALALSVDDFGDGIELGQGAAAGDRVRFDGTLPGITVTDSRNPDQAGNGGWSVTGQSSDFVNGAAEYGGDHLGWTPKLLEPKSGITVGAALETALSGGPGLGTPAALATALPSGRFGQTRVSADLRLELPVDALSGTYKGSVTLSLFPVD